MSLAEATVLESKSLLRSQEDHVRLLEREKEALVKVFPLLTSSWTLPLCRRRSSC